MNDMKFDPSAFLGGEAHVRKIQRKYAAMFQPGEVVLDLGCGNGVFLDLLRGRSVRGVGVDSFPQCVEACRRNGLDIRDAEILQYLQTTTESYDGLFLSHIVEHLPPQTVLDLFAHARRILRPSGRIIVVTPNCRDIEVITERFWLDITHVRPYPVQLLEKMLEHSGFAIHSSGLDPHSATHILSRSPLKTARRIMKKLRWGEYWGKGDTFVVGKVR